MAIKNIKDLLTQATTLPAAIEARLPEGAPKVSTMLLDAVNTIPAIPDFPVELPDLPAVPEIPKLPELPGTPALGRRYVTAVEVRPVATPRPVTATRPTPSVRYETTPAIGRGVLPEVITRRGM